MKKKFTVVFNLILILLILSSGDTFASYFPCSASTVIDYKPGKDKSGNELPADESNPSNALGAIVATPGIHHVALGFGGEITLYFNKAIHNGTDKDFSVVAFTDGKTCIDNPAKAEVWISKDNVNWHQLGETCLTNGFEIPSAVVNFQFIKIVDVSKPEEFTSQDANGFNLDAVVSNYCDAITQPLKPLTPLLKCIDKSNDGSFTAKFGYKNENAFNVTIVAGTDNSFTSGGSTNMGQITKFLANTTVESAFSVNVPENTTLTWSIIGPDGISRSISATINSSECNVVPLPTAKIRGGGSICEGEKATVYVDLTGQAPWSITYKGSDGVEVTKNNINSSPYIFLTNQQTVSLVSVSNLNGTGTVSGIATITKKTSPSATIEGDINICEGEKGNIKVDLTGQAPFTFVYSNVDETNVVQVNNHLTNEYLIEVNESRNIKLVSVQDAQCKGSVSGIANVVKKTGPIATISGDESICKGEKATVKIELKGESPYTFTYAEAGGKNPKTITNHSSESYMFEVEETMQYQLINIADASLCTGTVSGKASISKKLAPTATISGDAVLCHGETASVRVSLTGVAPFTFTYANTDGTNPITISDYSDQIYSFDVDKTSSFKLVSVSDAQCNGEISGSSSIKFRPSPTALISGDKTLCEGDKATITIDLTGNQPFSFTYSSKNGAPTTISNYVDNQYTFEVANAGEYQLLSVSDALCNGTPMGEAKINKDGFNVQLDLEDLYCSGSIVDIKPNIQSSGALITSWTSNGKGKIVSTGEFSYSYIPEKDDLQDVTIELTATSSCSSKKFSWSILYDAPLDTSFTYTPDNDIYPLQPVTFVANETAATSYYWIFEDGEEFQIQNPEKKFNEAGNYMMTLKVERNGCIAFGSSKIEVLESRDLYIPNIFNPNAIHADNKVVKVYGSDISDEDFQFVIFNKWGNVLYKTTDFNTATEIGWNGVANNGETQALGVYTYIVKGKYNDGTKFNKAGTITLAK